MSTQTNSPYQPFTDTRGLIALLVRRAGQFQSEEVRLNFLRSRIKDNENLVRYVIAQADCEISAQNEMEVLRFEAERLSQLTEDDGEKGTQGEGNRNGSEKADRSVAALNVYHRLERGEDVDILGEAVSRSDDRRTAIADATDISRRLIIMAIQQGYDGNPLRKRQSNVPHY